MTCGSRAEVISGLKLTKYIIQLSLDLAGSRRRPFGSCSLFMEHYKTVNCYIPLISQLC